MYDLHDMPGLPIELPKLLTQIEDEYTRRALAATLGNQTKAAQLLGMKRTTLVERLRRREAGMGRYTGGKHT